MIISEGVVTIQKVATEDNPSDMIIKVLPSSKFYYCLDLIQLKWSLSTVLSKISSHIVDPSKIHSYWTKVEICRFGPVSYADLFNSIQFYAILLLTD